MESSDLHILNGGALRSGHHGTRVPKTSAWTWTLFSDAKEEEEAGGGFKGGAPLHEKDIATPTSFSPLAVKMSLPLVGIKQRIVAHFTD